MKIGLAVVWIEATKVHSGAFLAAAVGLLPEPNPEDGLAPGLVGGDWLQGYFRSILRIGLLEYAP